MSGVIDYPGRSSKQESYTLQSFSDDIFDAMNKASAAGLHNMSVLGILTMCQHSFANTIEAEIFVMEDEQEQKQG